MCILIDAFVFEIKDGQENRILSVPLVMIFQVHQRQTNRDRDENLVSIPQWDLGTDRSKVKNFFLAEEL
jgi:hypothetical protein